MVQSHALLTSFYPTNPTEGGAPGLGAAKLVHVRLLRDKYKNFPYFSIRLESWFTSNSWGGDHSKILSPRTISFQILKTAESGKFQSAGVAQEEKSSKIVC